MTTTSLDRTTLRTKPTFALGHRALVDPDDHRPSDGRRGNPQPGHAMNRAGMVRWTASTVACGVLALTSCAAPDEDRASDGSGTATQPDREVTLTLDEHVLTEIAGFDADGTATVQGVAAFAKAHQHKPEELRERGLVRGVTQTFAPEGKAFGQGFSVAEEFATAEQAGDEAERLFASNSAPPRGAEAVPLEVPRVPDADAVVITGDFEGEPVTGVEIVFVDGVVLHELFVVGEDPLVSPAVLADAAADLYESVTGRPLG
ncbi:hypothetical protein [Nocardioides bizhenqiangii]|uniref:Uncharacterized protein n=1 Tax=Nocardioides bizhenqiangii TaxID=3095076 RepID=A0ABZ0ZR80_9ACTN|nr:MULTISPECIES: hypothetical protein [unclassified Nocardioides]MDZ5619563.1 hypothetical protein [Nocardioides sp. HM23]WQQ26421.1 hypothetical protein SHK19_21005 [Nocardioides sp. HM61]